MDNKQCAFLTFNSCEDWIT
uniref:Uncharacterized protein n=1 Tax=Arundo donax TaxID=35708 RepID=A0A0A9BVN9_ARUDO